MFCSRCGTEVVVSSKFCPTCGLDLTTITQGMTAAQPAAQPPQPDEAEIVRDALKDEYELEKELGRGGMAIVFKARDKSLEREVAIKVLPFSLSFDAEFVERFQREARTAGKLEHPNIIPIYRVGKSGRVIYFVMKFIRGKSLSAVVEARGAIPVPEMKRVLIECSRALGFAHKHGIVHRDIKPDNIMFDELGQAIVTDFGIAKAQSGARLTGTGMSIGTPHYMSPEQARAQNLDGRSDIYSLGVVAYQCLTGHVPFDGEDSFSIGYKHIMEELPVPPLENADQRELFTVIQKMMAKKAEDRFQTAEDVVHALEGLGGPSARVSMADLATMPTRAIEPMKAPPPAMSFAATTPLPRASASMGVPADVAAAAAAKAAASAPPAGPAKGKLGPRPVPKAKSKAPFYALGGVAVVALALGGYMVFGRGTPPVTVVPPADTTHPVAVTPDTAKARADSAAAHAAAPPTVPAGSRATPSRTNPPARPVTAAAPTGPAGTLSLSGNIPRGATITVDGRRGSEHEKLPPGRHSLRVEAPGFQRYEAQVDIASGQVSPHTVTMLPAASAPPAAAAPQASSTAPAADCANPSIGVRNTNNACFNVRPSPRTLPMAAAPASCTGTITPATVLLRVSATGDVATAQINGRSSCAAFNDAALAVSRDLSFTPATKGGQPVEAWVLQLIRPISR
jgi:predicted Ser/Thr protein kinase